MGSKKTQFSILAKSTKKPGEEKVTQQTKHQKLEEQKENPFFHLLPPYHEHKEKIPVKPATTQKANVSRTKTIPENPKKKNAETFAGSSKNKTSPKLQTHLLIHRTTTLSVSILLPENKPERIPIVRFLDLPNQNQLIN